MSDTPEGTVHADVLIRRGLKLTHLRLLRALGETGQVSAAADLLAMSQPSASRMMADLERIAGTKLYERLPRGVALTEAGEVLAGRARRITSELDDAGEDLALLSSGVRGSVSIGAVTAAAVDIVLPALQTLRRSYPDIEITVLVDTSDRLAEGLATRELDLYLGRLTPALPARSVELRPVGPEQLDLMVRADHPLLSRSSISLDDCLAFDWVLQPQGRLLRQTVELYLLETGYGLPPRHVSTSSMLVTLALISSTDAIAPFARSAAGFFTGEDPRPSRFAVLPVDQRMTVSPYSVVTRSEEPLSASARIVFQAIMEGVDAKRA
ncbi:LysR family transcriptional regulator [Histidinibacterium aquaticum]|uniref:LysR family transcriptional regulator n=1 Tax=Histidinibacterium aquaticum TaxID=2613962 RepID=A0A5J5GJ12_9RHOB|nr:LysR family transcriptional regulator [Histidinibacterium aquaticum]KAA9008030.1 LysR family transcriptional regulator [Histidinibacterium aquaticum]